MTKKKKKHSIKAVNENTHERALQAILDLICEYNELEEIRTLYKSIEDLLVKEFSISPFLILSKPEGTANPNYVRNHWNKKLIEEYSKKELDGFVDLIKEKENGFEGTFTHSVDSGKFYSVPFGVRDDQFYFAVWKSENEIPEDFLNYLIKFIHTTHQMMNKWNEITRIKDLIYRDDVTNLFNQRKLLKDIESSIERHASYGECFSVLFIDVDHFKSVNDGHGHMVGTQILSDIAAILNKVLRPTDLTYRYGGDEFVVILPDTSKVMGALVGNRILEAVKEAEFYIKDTKEAKKLTVSIGIASFPENAKNCEEILEIADQMMYESKESGRGKITTATVTTDSQKSEKKIKKQA